MTLPSVQLKISHANRMFNIQISQGDLEIEIINEDGSLEQTIWLDKQEFDQFVRSCTFLLDLNNIK